jgi:hypothetical protein
MVTSCSADSTGSQTSHEYTSTVTEQAGDEFFPKVYTDTISLLWTCSSSGEISISSGTQVPTVEKAGLSLEGVSLYALGLIGLGYTVDGNSILSVDNTSSPPSLTASGLSFDESFNAGQLIFDLVPGVVLEKLGIGLLPLIRSGQLGKLAIQALSDWGQIVSYAISNVPKWVTPFLGPFLGGLPVDQLQKRLMDVGSLWVHYIVRSLAAAGHPTPTNLLNAVKSAIQAATNALTFKSVDWAPQVVVSVASPTDVNPSFSGTTNTGISLQPAQVTTTQVG